MVQSLGNLCVSLKNLVGVFLIFLSILTGIIYALGTYVWTKKKKTLMLISKILLAFVILTIILYVVTPYIVGWLITGEFYNTEWINDCCAYPSEGVCAPKEINETYL